MSANDPKRTSWLHRLTLLRQIDTQPTSIIIGRRSGLRLLQGTRAGGGNPDRLVPSGHKGLDAVRTVVGAKMGSVRLGGWFRCRIREGVDEFLRLAESRQILVGAVVLFRAFAVERREPAGDHAHHGEQVQFRSFVEEALKDQAGPAQLSQ